MSRIGLRADLQFASVPDMVSAHGTRFAGREALVDADRRLTYREVASEMVGAARAMMSLGIKHGDRVALWAPNSIQWVIAALGIMASGAVLVPINTRFRGDEAAYIVERSGSCALFTAGGFLGIDFVGMLGEVAPELPALERVISIDDVIIDRCITWGDFMERATVSAADAERAITATRGEDASDILFTSGTTGAPKGVMSTHSQTLRTFWALNQGYGVQPGDRMAIVNPFFHAFGYKAGWLLCLMAGATAYPLPILDPSRLATLISDEQVTVLPGPPTVFHSLMDISDGEVGAFESLRLAYVGATTVPADLVRSLSDKLGVDRVCTGYGLTEATAVVSTSTPTDDIERVAQWCGVPIDGIEVEIVGADALPVPRGMPGEVQVRGFNVMKGYFEDPQATAKAIDDNGWLRTGDMGIMDDEGYLQIVDRIKDIYITGGFNVSPAEVENVLTRHEDILQAAVVGVPDARLGEVGVAFVVLQGGVTLDTIAIARWLASLLANFKLPRHFVVVEELPRNATGKVMKAELIQQFHSDQHGRNRSVEGSIDQ